MEMQSIFRFGFAVGNFVDFKKLTELKLVGLQIMLSFQFIKKIARYNVSSYI